MPSFFTEMHLKASNLNRPNLYRRLETITEILLQKNALIPMNVIFKTVIKRTIIIHNVYFLIYISIRFNVPQ